jgi:ribosome assembly protein RRB1
MLHRANTEWPCLSCDFLLPLDIPYQVKNPLYRKMEKYPLEVFFIAGT